MKKASRFTLGRFMSHNYAEYHVPVDADIGATDVLLIEEDAAVCNAISHATRRCVLSMPTTLDKVMARWLAREVLQAPGIPLVFRSARLNMQ